MQLATTSAAVRYRNVHYVYVLRSAKDGKLYTGYTADIRQRVAEHVAGRASSTPDRRPMKLIYDELRGERQPLVLKRSPDCAYHFPHDPYE